MKKLKKSVLFVLALIIALSTCVLFPVTANAASWKTAYLDYVEELMNKANSEGIKSARFGLIDFDEDGIPELIYDSGFHLLGGSLSCYHYGINTTSMGRGTYLRNGNLLYVNYGYQGTKIDSVIRISRNAPVYVFQGTKTAKGTNFSSTNPNDFTYKYRLENQKNDTVVTYSQYNNQLNTAFNFNTAIDLKSSITLTFSGIKTAITNYYDSSNIPNVTLTNTASGVRADWQIIPECFAYDVYYKKSSDANWTHADTQNNSFTVPNSQSGVLYYVQVKPIFSGNVPNYYSKVKSMTFIAKPVISGLTYNGNNTLTWNRINGANKYQIARKKSGESAYNYFTTTATTYTEKSITANTTYIYQVRAMYETANNGTAYGVWSDSKSVATREKPTLSLSNKSNGIRAEWNKISGANKYIVYFKKTGNSSWSSVQTSNNYYPLLNLTPGMNYCVQVQSIGSNNEKGDYSKVQYLTYIPAVQPNVSLSNKSNGIRAEWNKVSGATEYIVYYMEAGTKWSSATTKNNYFPYLNTKSGTLYYVQVQPIFNGAKGLYSKVKSLTFIAQPKLSGNKQSGNVKLTWNAIGGANRYQIATRKVGESAYRYITVYNTSYLDSSFKKGENEYQVRAMYATENNGTAYGYWSNTQRVTM